MLAWFDRLSLRAKLNLSFGALIALTMAVTLTAMVQQRAALDAAQALLERQHRLDSLAERSIDALERARRHERELRLALADVVSRGEPVHRAAALGEIAILRRNLDSLRNASDDSELLRVGKLADQAAARYGALLERLLPGPQDTAAIRAQEVDAATRPLADLLDKLHLVAENVGDRARGEAARLTRFTLWAVVGISAAAALLGTLLAHFVSGHVSQVVRRGRVFAERLAEGDLTARLNPRRGGPDFDAAAQALNRMADALQEARRVQEDQAADLRQMNRTLRVLSLCNEALVRAQNEPDLLQAICSNLVEIGGYRAAWVGYKRHDEDGSVALMAHAGADRDFVHRLKISWAEAGSSPSGTAIREGRPVFARLTDPDPALGPWQAEALRRGIAALMALPLVGRGEILGNLSIYSSESDAFDEQEVKLLQELADDLGYGIASLREAAARERFQREAEYHANFDGLTGLANRNLFHDRLGQALAHAGRAGKKAAVLLLNLDRFKVVIESMGHEAGDALLIHIAANLTRSLRDGDTVARFTGDEFAVAVSDVSRDDEAAVVARKVLEAVAQPMQWQGQEIRLTASLGVGLFPRDGGDADSLLRNAAAAMHSARAAGGSGFRYYAPEMNERLSRRFALESELHRALERDELVLHYQPRVSLASGEITGAEALVRWAHPERGLVPPGEFIPVAEESGLIQPLGEWVVESACAQLAAWRQAGLRPIPVAVNLSARQFRQKNLAAVIRQSLSVNGVEARLLELEITESILMEDVDAAVATLQELKAIGLSLSLDDFGTGYSSLAYLKRFPIDLLKIDRSFVRDLITDPDDAAICIAVIGLAHTLKLAVVAEGVETEGQANYLRQHHCDTMQGYHFSPPVPAAEFAALLQQGRTLALPREEARPGLLLVDDEPHILSALRRLLRRDGYDIHTAGSAREGFDILATRAIQVILSDQRMPEMNGTEFLSRVKELYPDTVRIVLSGYTELTSITEAINRGAIYKYLTKPWEEEALRQTVREAFRQHEGGRRKEAVAYGFSPDAD